METFSNFSRLRSPFISNGTRTALQPEQPLRSIFSEKPAPLTQPPKLLALGFGGWCVFSVDSQRKLQAGQS